MTARKWLAWAVLVASAVIGAKWMQAGDGPTFEPPPLDGFVPTEANPPAPPSRPRSFHPTVPVDDLNQVPTRQSMGVNHPQPIEMPNDTLVSPDRPTNVIQSPTIEMPADFDSSAHRGLPPRRTMPIRLGSDPRFPDGPQDEIIPTGVFVPTNNEPLGSIETVEATSRRRQQAVSVEWVGPSQITIGKPFIYELVVRNNGDIPAGDVVVRDRLPESMRVLNVDPAAAQSPDGYSWNLGSLQPQEERRIRLELAANQRGDVACHATVSASTNTQAMIRVTQPQLALNQAAPDKVMVGDPLTVNIAVSNPGDGPADHVVLRTVLSEGLRHDKGNDFSVDVGTIGPGESKVVQLICATVSGGGQRVVAFASGEGDIEATSESTTQVTEAILEAVFEGPSLRYLDRQAIYTVKITNPGDAPADNVKAVCTVPPGFKFLASSAGGRHDFTTSSVTWIIGNINPGEVKEVSYKVVAVQPGNQRHVVNVTGGRGLKKDTEITTRVEGISALLLEVVDIDDPVEVGSETAYEIRVTNQGSRDATNVEIHALVPPEMSVRGGQGPTRYRVEGQEVLFSPLPQLAPRADAIYRILVTGTAKGDVRFRARLISDSLTEPVIEEESTKVYED